MLQCIPENLFGRQEFIVRKHLSARRVDNDVIVLEKQIELNRFTLLDRGPGRNGCREMECGARAVGFVERITCLGNRKEFSIPQPQQNPGKIVRLVGDNSPSKLYAAHAEKILNLIGMDLRTNARRCKIGDQLHTLSGTAASLGVKQEHVLKLIAQRTRLGFGAGKPDSVPRLAALQSSFLSPVFTDAPLARGAAYPQLSSGPLSCLFCLAPDGVFRAASIAFGAVGSYPTFSPLPAQNRSSEPAV